MIGVNKGFSAMLPRDPTPEKPKYITKFRQVIEFKMFSHIFSLKLYVTKERKP